MLLLKLTSITKSYAGVHALRDVSFALRAGEVHALVGENGAGKSTLMKIITGAVAADAGTVEVDGQVMEDMSPLRAKVLGIAAIYQQPALFPDLTIAENIALAQEPSGLWRRVHWRTRRAQAAALLQRIGARISPDSPVSRLTMPEQQMVEIARALGTNARILIMDEPTASLTDREVIHLFQVIQDLRRQGVGIIYISHRLEELFEVGDRVTVLRDGEVIQTAPMSDVNPQSLIRLMVGRDLPAVFPKRTVSIGDVALETRNLTCRAAGVRAVSLSLRAGEILGLAGLIGSGRTELAWTLFGLTSADAGQIFVAGKEVRMTSPAQAIQRGLAYLPEDRRRHGVILDMPIAANVTLASLSTITHRGFLDFARESALAADFADRLAIKAPSVFVPVNHLSGGNQQKVALSRWLATRPSVLILDEPTQGIDVGAKAEIHRLMCDLAEQGLAILMISSELPEILGMSDRIAVMREGTIAGIMDRSEATPPKILALALGH